MKNPLNSFTRLLQKRSKVSLIRCQSFLFDIDIPPIRCKQHAMSTKRTKFHWMLWSRYGWMLFCLISTCVMHDIVRENEWTWMCSQCLSSFSETASPKYTFIIMSVSKFLQALSFHCSPLTIRTWHILFLKGCVVATLCSLNLRIHLFLSMPYLTLVRRLSQVLKPLTIIYSVVDKALQVIDQYHANITKFEHDILLKPKMSTVRKCTFNKELLLLCSRRVPVHILSGDLILHKRTLEPIKTLVYGLRRYDVDRCEALIDRSDLANKDVKVVGFMSHTSKIYLVRPVFAVFQTKHLQCRDCRRMYLTTWNIF